jgi:hypothetical protein
MHTATFTTAPAPAIQGSTLVFFWMYSPAVTTAYMPLNTYPSRITGTIGSPCQYSGSLGK